MKDLEKDDEASPPEDPGKVLDLIDGATGEVAEISKELQPLREVILDKESSLE